MSEHSHFWIGDYGRIVERGTWRDGRLPLTVAFELRDEFEQAEVTAHQRDLRFTMRSSLTRSGLDMSRTGAPLLDGRRVLLEVEAFHYDPTFANAGWWHELLTHGLPVGRLFHAPAAARLSSARIWEELAAHRLKLPDSISIDRHGRVVITPHRVKYTLNAKLRRDQYEQLLDIDSPRAFLDKVLVRHDTDVLIVPPGAGILTSCSMYLRSHYVVLNRGGGEFGLHAGSVVLDPVRTFGTQVLLEIYNTSDQPIVNPVVSVDVYQAPPRDRNDGDGAVARLGEAALRETDAPRARTISIPRGTRRLPRGAQAPGPNPCSLFADDHRRVLVADDVASALSDEAATQASTLAMEFFPNLSEHMALLAHVGDSPLRRLIFRRATRANAFFLSAQAHAQLENYAALGLDVFWHDANSGEVHRHVYKRDQGFFVREHRVEAFLEAAVIAFYGSALAMEAEETARIRALVDRLSRFIGSPFGVLTGGGPGVMQLALDRAREAGGLTGACYLELEAQPPELGVDFFNTFEETCRHNRQKWFQAADFCVFNVGGIGTLEEVGIELCNLKLGIRPRAPFVFYNARYWDPLRRQLADMVADKRAPAWMLDYVLFTNDPDEVVSFYRRTLKVL